MAADKVQLVQDRTDSNYQAWQVVNSAQGKGGSGGRIDALAKLVKNSQSLAGVNVDGAWLAGVDLRKADLEHASFKNANLQGALLGADLQDLVGWREIVSVNYTRVADVQRTPRGFLDWAIGEGAEGVASQSTDSGDDSYSMQFRAV